MPYLSKPLDEFITLDKHLNLLGMRFKISSGQIVPSDHLVQHEMTVVLQKGTVSIRRENQRILLGLVQGPMIFGLGAAASTVHNEYTLTAEADCCGYYLPAKDSLQCLEQNQLWREAFYWMTWQIRMLELRDQQLVGTNHYQQIRSTLFMMMSWDENIRGRIGVLNYIQQRTGISRSVIAEVLSALRKGDYIQMEKGKLVGVTRLPSEY